MKVTSAENYAAVRRYQEILDRRQADQMSLRRQQEQRERIERQRAEVIRKSRMPGSDLGNNVDISV